MKHLIFISFMVIALFTVYSFAAETIHKTNYQNNPKIMGKFQDTGINWQTNGIISLTEPVHFPHQDPNRSNTQSCPIVLNNGDVLLIWSEPDNLAFSRSTDGGENWQTPESIVSGFGYVPDHLSGICTQTGRAIIIWRDTQILELMMSFSDDNGVSWTGPTQISFWGNERWTSLSQTLDGTLWLFYADDIPGNARDVFYITSTDNGDNWSGEQPFLSTPEPSSEINASVISADASTLLAFYQDNASGFSHIYQMRSSDGGQTWSSAVVIGQVFQDEFRPRAIRQSDGTLWLIYGANSPTPVLGAMQGDIYYVTSSDGGGSWSTPAQFTYYVGNDDGHNVDLLNDQPFISFNSYRWANWNQYQIWYGIIGITNDTNLPPALFNRDITPPLPSQPVTVRAHVDDESGISNVTINYTLDGVATGPFQMYDDGNHNDNNPSDNIWGTDIGPFQIGDTIAYWFSIYDNSGNSVENDAGSFDMPPIHTAGNLILSVSENSKLADEGQVVGRSAYWPVAGGLDYLYLGGLWMGADVSGEQRVMNMHYNQRDWTHVSGTPVTIGPGISDQDIYMYYDDQFAHSAPIGLEVHQESYQWSDPTKDDFIIFRYTVTNTGLNGNLNNLYMAVWLDPDINSAPSVGYADDQGGYDFQRGLAYIFDPAQNPPARLGIKLFGEIPHTANIHSGGDPNDDQQRFQFMTSGYQTNATWGADWRILLTAPPFNLLAGESHTVGFGLVMGTESELLANTDAMISLYEQVWGVSQPIPSPGNLIAIDKLDNQVALYWDDPGGSPDFNIYRKGPSDPSFSQIATVPTGQNRYIDYNVINDQVYEYYVTAIYLTGESDPSNTTTGYPIAIPDNPGKVVAFTRPGGRPYGIACDGNSVWMADYYFDQIRQFDPNTWQWVGQIPTPGGGGSYGLAWDGTALWVAHLDPGALYQIDLSGNILQQIDIQPGTATGVAYENGNIWTMDRNNWVAYKYDAVSAQLLQTFPFPDFQGAVPRGLAYLPDRGTFIVGVTGASMIYELTTTDFTFTGRYFEFNMEYDPGSGEFNSSVRGVAYNTLNGNYWIGDVQTNMVYEVQPFSVFLLADKCIDFKAHDFSEGDIYSNGEIRFSKGNPSIHKGNITLVGDIEVREKNTIIGDVSAGGTISLFGNAVITGEQNANAAVAPIPLPVLPLFSYGSTNVTVQKNEVMSLLPGDYKIVKVMKNATLSLNSYADGTYNIKQLELAESALLEIDASGMVVVNIENNLESNKKAATVLTGGTTRNVVFNVKGNIVKLWDNTIWLGSIFAPNARVTLEKNAFFKGTICAQQIELQKGVVAVYHNSSVPLLKLLPNRGDDEGIEEIASLPTEYAVIQNYPNPFNAVTTIQYQLPEQVNVKLEIFSVRGQSVATLVDEEKDAGYYSVKWDASRISTGVYFYRLTAGDFSEVKKCMFIK